MLLPGLLMLIILTESEVVITQTHRTLHYFLVRSANLPEGLYILLALISPFLL